MSGAFTPTRISGKEKSCYMYFSTSRRQVCCCLIKSEQIVGHVPKTLAPVISQFLKRECNKGMVRITGKRIGGGFGLEAPCIFRLYGPDAYLAR